MAGKRPFAKKPEKKPEKKAEKKAVSVQSSCRKNGKSKKPGFKERILQQIKLLHSMPPEKANERRALRNEITSKLNEKMESIELRRAKIFHLSERTEKNLSTAQVIELSQLEIGTQKLKILRSFLEGKTDIKSFLDEIELAQTQIARLKKLHGRD